MKLNFLLFICLLTIYSSYSKSIGCKIVAVNGEIKNFFMALKKEKETQAGFLSFEEKNPGNIRMIKLMSHQGSIQPIVSFIEGKEATEISTEPSISGGFIVNMKTRLSVPSRLQVKKMNLLYRLTFAGLDKNEFSGSIFVRSLEPQNYHMKEFRHLARMRCSRDFL